MSAKDSWGGTYNKPPCPAVPGTYEFLHPAFSPILLSAKHSVCQYHQDGAKKVGYLMQEARPFQAPLGVLQGINTLLPSIFPKRSSHLSSNSKLKSPFLGQTSISKHPSKHMFPS